MAKHNHGKHQDTKGMNKGMDKGIDKETKKEPGKNNKVSNMIIFSVIVLIFISIIVYSIASKRNDMDPSTVAKCLKDKGAVLYASQYCSHCKEQKAMFGEYLNQIDMVECSTQVAECETAGVTAYPTWSIGGRKFLGTKDLKTLYALAECGN